MKVTDIPTLKASAAARFDAATIRAVTARLRLEFPDDATDLPRLAVVTVAVAAPFRPGDPVVAAPFRPGDPVAAATVDGRVVTGFFRRCGADAVIESLRRRERLRWLAAEEPVRIRWIFPIVRGVMPGVRFPGKEKGRNAG